MEQGKRVVRQYEMSFKIDAVELVEKQGYSVVAALGRVRSFRPSDAPVRQTTGRTRRVTERPHPQGEAARRLGIPENNLYHWRRQYREGRLLPDQKRAQPIPEEAELRRLHEENKRLKLEVEILKKATIYFVRQQT